MRTACGELVQARGGQLEPAQVGLEVEERVVADQLVGDVAVAPCARVSSRISRRCSARCASSSSFGRGPVSSASTTFA